MLEHTVGEPGQSSRDSSRSAIRHPVTYNHLVWANLDNRWHRSCLRLTSPFTSSWWRLTYVIWKPLQNIIVSLLCLTHIPPHKFNPSPTVICDITGLVIRTGNRDVHLFPCFESDHITMPDHISADHILQSDVWVFVDITILPQILHRTLLQWTQFIEVYQNVQSLLYNENVWRKRRIQSSWLSTEMSNEFNNVLNISMEEHEPR